MGTNANREKLNRPLRLRNFPITFFAISLGMAGFALSVQKLAGIDGTGMAPALDILATILVWLACILFALTGVIYAVKAVRYPQMLESELTHPTKISFFPLDAKILLVLSIIFLERELRVSRALWIMGTAAQFAASVAIISSWIRHAHYTIEHMTPAWFIPIVGSLMVPIAGVAHGFVEISWFFFSVGLIFWLVLFVIVIYRLIFHPPIPDKLLPTLFILFAPPAIASIAYAKLLGLSLGGGGPDPFARILYFFSLFMFLLVLAQSRAFTKIRFFLSWWAYSFPLAAQALASMQMLHLTHHDFYKYLALSEVGLLTLLVTALASLTIRAIARVEICVEE